MSESLNRSSKGTPEADSSGLGSQPSKGAAHEPMAGNPRRDSPWRTVAIAAALVVVLAVLAAVGYGLVTHPPFTAVLRDISIIVLALVTMVTCVFLAILLFQLQSLIVLLREEIQPTLKSIGETVGTVRGTTTFVSDAVVTPLIAVASYATAVRATTRSLFRSSGRSVDNTGSPKQPE